MSACSIKILLELRLGDLVGRAPAPFPGRHTAGSAGVAVFGPMPGTPGTLSTLSPISASTSPTFSGPTPNFSITCSRSMRRSFIVSSMSTLPSSISCIRSLSELTIVTFQPAPGRRHHVAGDDVVGLQPLFLDAGDGEGAGRDADQRELRDQIFGRRRPVAPCTGRTSRCGGSAPTRRGSPPCGSARRPCSSPSASFHSIAV